MRLTDAAPAMPDMKQERDRGVRVEPIVRRCQQRIQL